MKNKLKNNSQSEQLINEPNDQMQIKETQVAKLTEIGAQLRQKRLEQSITLEEMAVRTMIRGQMLHAIEEGKLERLPEPVYIQGLLLRYANALGFNGQAIARDFPLSQKRFTFKKFWVNLSDYLPRWKFRSFHLYFAYLVMVIVAVQALSNRLNSSASLMANSESEQKAALLAAEARQQANPTKSNSVAAIEPSAGAPSPPIADNNRVRVGLTLKDSSWVVIEADGKTEFEGMLPSGTQRTWEASEKLIVFAGNAGGVLLAVNNGQAEQMGAPGETIEREVVVPQP